MFDYFENKNILITGGNGYLASNVIHLLQDVHCTIRRFGRKGTNWQNFKNTGKTR
ncbi:MAG: hypothetical protein HW374_638, partial [Bacteroidetes bacterium]|nr:hypothetical protein [Bacteroidota bacterium]